MAAFAGVEIRDDEFETICQIVRTAAGITLNGTKRALVVSRLSKRLRHYGYESFRQYCAHLLERDVGGSETLEMINCITTNKTEFFRESHHFDWMRQVFLPSVVTRAAASKAKKLRIWSAGCSTGQEPYSIAMVVADALGAQGWDIRILASDIDTKVLAAAESGIYAAEDAVGIPDAFLHKYFEQRGADVVASKAIRDLITFRRINFIDSSWPIRAKFDVIFCRNVTIYFDRETQATVYDRFAKQLNDPGYLVAGHSENLHWLSRLFAPVGATIYAAVGAHGARTSRAPSKGAISRRPPMRASSQRLPVAAKPPTRRPPRPSRMPAAARSVRAPVEEVAIQSGGLHASATPVLVRTVLGSCVAACIYDPDARVGGMNHFMLPDGCDTDWVPTRFGTHAMNKLLDEIAKRGGERARLKAKIFGGAHVLRSVSASRSVPDFNVEFVREYLAAQRIPIQAEKVGGELPMLVRFETHTGRAFVRIVEASKLEEVTRVELRYRSELNAVAQQSERLLKVRESSR